MGRTGEQYLQPGRGDHKERNDLYLIKNAVVWIVWTAAFLYELRRLMKNRLYKWELKKTQNKYIMEIVIWKIEVNYGSRSVLDERGILWTKD